MAFFQAEYAIHGDLDFSAILVSAEPTAC